MECPVENELPSINPYIVTLIRTGLDPLTIHHLDATDDDDALAKVREKALSKGLPSSSQDDLVKFTRPDRSEGPVVTVGTLLR